MKTKISRPTHRSLAILTAVVTAITLLPSTSFAGYSQDLPNVYLMSDGHPQSSSRYRGSCDYALCGFRHLLQVKVGGSWYNWNETATTRDASVASVFTQNTGNYCPVGASVVSAPYRTSSNLTVTNTYSSTISVSLGGTLALKIFTFNAGGSGTYTILTSSAKTITTYSSEKALVCS